MMSVGEVDMMRRILMIRMTYSVLKDVLQHFFCKCWNNIFLLQPVAGAARGAGGHDRRARRGARAAELAAMARGTAGRAGRARWGGGEQGMGRKKATLARVCYFGAFDELLDLYSWF
jgi:hypothetical protein